MRNVKPHFFILQASLDSLSYFFWVAHYGKTPSAEENSKHKSGLFSICHYLSSVHRWRFPSLHPPVHTKHQTHLYLWSLLQSILRLCARPTLTWLLQNESVWICIFLMSGVFVANLKLSVSKRETFLWIQLLPSVKSKLSLPRIIL